MIKAIHTEHYSKTSKKLIILGPENFINLLRLLINRAKIYMGAIMLGPRSVLKMLIYRGLLSYQLLIHRDFSVFFNQENIHILIILHSKNHMHP